MTGRQLDRAELQRKALDTIARFVDEMMTDRNLGAAEQRSVLASVADIAKSALAREPFEVHASTVECAQGTEEEPGRWPVLAWLERVMSFEGSTEQAKALARDAYNHVGRPRFEWNPANQGFGFVSVEPDAVTFPTRAHELEWLIEQCREGRPIPTALQDPRRAADVLRLALIGYRTLQADGASRELEQAVADNRRGK